MSKVMKAEAEYLLSDDWEDMDESEMSYASFELIDFNDEWEPFEIATRPPRPPITEAEYWHEVFDLLLARFMFEGGFDPEWRRVE